MNTVLAWYAGSLSVTLPAFTMTALYGSPAYAESGGELGFGKT
jgi:hypothetical protein